MLANYITTFFLNLKDISVFIFSNNSITIQLPRNFHSCPSCGHSTNKIHDYRIQPFKHIPIPHLDYSIFLRKRRYVCSHCSKRFFEHNHFLPKYQRISTNLKKHIIFSFSQMKSASSIARDSKLSVSTVIRLFDHVSYPMPALASVISIDEFKGNADGEKFQSIIVNPIDKKVLDVLPNRKTDDLCRYFSSYTLQERANVKYAVMDLSNIFKSAVRACLPNAKIVADKFHVCRLANWALDNIRREVQKEFATGRRKYFKNSRKLLLMRRKKLKSPDRIEQLANMLDVSEKLKRGYRLKELFYEVMDSRDSAEYVKRFKKWQEEVKSCNLKEFNKMLKTIIEWKKEIIASIATGYNNGYVEGCNNRTKVLKRTCYGIRRFSRLRNRIIYMANNGTEK